MALFNVDIGGYLREARDRKAEEKRMAALRQAGDTLFSVMSQRPTVGADTDSLAGVTGRDPAADLQAELRNEEVATAAAQSDYSAQINRALFDITALGGKPKDFIEPAEILAKRRAIESLKGGLDPAQAAAIENGIDASAFRFSEAGIGNRYSGDFSPSELLLEKAAQARAASRASDALAGTRNATRRITDMRGAALEAVFDEPMNPLVMADIANSKAVATPKQTWVRRQDGTQVLMDAVPDLSGGFTYVPASSNGQPVVSTEDPNQDDRPALQKNAAYIAKQFGIQESDATRILLFSKGKSPEAAWEDMVKSVQRANSTDDAAMVEEKARALWNIARAGEPVPGRSLVPPATGASSASDRIYEEARQAIANGAPAEAVRARLKSMGLDPSQL